MATFDLGGKIKVVSKVANVDNNYGPYEGTTEAEAITAAHTGVGALITKGVTVGLIVNGGPIQEYWYETGVNESDLKKKGTTGGIQNSNYTDNAVLVGGNTAGTVTSVTLTNDSVLGKIGNTEPSAIPIIGDISNVSNTDNNQLVYAKTIKKYVDDTTSSAQIFQGGYDAFNNTPALDTLASGNPIQKGWTYIVTVAGVFFTKQVYIGDHLVANQNSPTLFTHWTVVENGLQGASTTVAGIIELADSAEAIAGTASNLAITPATLKTVLGTTTTLSITKKFTTPILSTSSSIPYTHGLNTKDAMVMIRQLNFPYQEVDADIEFTDNNTVTVSFPVTPAANTYQLTIIG